MAISEIQVISRKQSRALILDMARYGENRHNISATEADEAIIAWFEQNGEPFAALEINTKSPPPKRPEPDILT